MHPKIHPMKLRRFYNRLLGNWLRHHLRGLHALCWTLPRYVSGSLCPFRESTVPSVPVLVWARVQWISMRKWEYPRLDVSVMDGMGEHYGYPRHHVLLLLWWNRRAYAFGIEFIPSDRHRIEGLESPKIK